MSLLNEQNLPKTRIIKAGAKELRFKGWKTINGVRAGQRIIPTTIYATARVPVSQKGPRVIGVTE